MWRKYHARNPPTLPLLQTVAGFLPGFTSIFGHRTSVIIVLLVAFAVRAYGIGVHSLWYDETVSVYLANQPVHELLAHTARDIHPPAYYLLLSLWQQMTTPSPQRGLELIYAYPSLMFGVLVVALLYPISRRLNLSPFAAVVTTLLAAVHPFHVWYSQEVRMYTAAVFWCLLSVWLSLRWLGNSAPSDPASESTTPLSSSRATGAQRVPPARSRTAVLYVLAGTLNLYLLYYTGLTLAGISLFVLWSISARRDRPAKTQRIIYWILINVLLIALWAPWIPTFVRQVANPPVPAWRQPWNSLETVLSALGDTVAALLVGQTLMALRWVVYVVWGAITVVAVWFYYTKQKGHLSAVSRLALCCLGLPVLILFAVSVVGIPIYHVRYVFIYSPFALLWVSALLFSPARAPQWPASVVLLSILSLQAGGLYDYWRNPALQPDDHRGAVQLLAESWRPGDAIVLNAGWLYPAVTTYWPQESDSDQAAPPSIKRRLRLDQLANESGHSDALTQAPVLLMAGSVDGATNLGWGLEESDFFPTTPDRTTAALGQLNQNARRIWHYRMYDTVSDPAGLIRDWFSMQTQLIFSLPIAGRDFGRLELFSTSYEHTYTPSANDEPVAIFEDLLTLLDVRAFGDPEAGRLHYYELWWQAHADVAAQGTELAMSLRLYDEDLQVVAQQDKTPYVPTSSWSLDRPTRLVLALPIPDNVGTGIYTAGLIVYPIDSLTPLTVDGTTVAGLPTTLLLGELGPEIMQ